MCAALAKMARLPIGSGRSRSQGTNALAKVPRKFRRVDKLLFVSVEKQAAKLGKDSLLFKTLQGDSRAATDAKRTSTGMQAVYRVLEGIRTNETLGTIYTITDLTNLKCKGESLKALTDFKRDWQYYARNCAGIDEALKTSLLLDRIDSIKCLENKTFDFHDIHLDSPRRCQQTLLNIITTYLRIATEKQNMKFRDYGSGTGRSSSHESTFNQESSATRRERKNKGV